MKREFRVISTYDEFGEKTLNHDYNIVMEKTKHETIYTLYRSDNSEWTVQSRGELCVKVFDDGNGLIFPKKLPSKELDYLEASELLITLKFINNMNPPLYQGYFEEIVPSERIDI